MGGGKHWQIWDGGLGELILTDGTENLATQQRIEGYLAHKWGLEGSLPARHPYRAVGLRKARIGNWTPARIKTALWLDAADASTITHVGGAVSRWNDKSGNGYDFVQTKDFRQPSTGSITVNGLNALDFDTAGNGATMAGKGDGGAPHITGNGTWFFVTKYAGTGAWLWTNWGRSNGIGTRTLGLETNKDTTAESAKSTITYTDSPASIISVERNFDTSTVTFSKNGGASLQTDDVTLNSNRTTTNGPYLGSYDGSGSYTGTMCEVVIIEGILSAGDKAKMEGYLAHKWGLAGRLPAGHPYSIADVAKPGADRARD
jgi:hypothetical protein